MGWADVQLTANELFGLIIIKVIKLHVIASCFNFLFINYVYIPIQRNMINMLDSISFASNDQTDIRLRLKQAV